MASKFTKDHLLEFVLVFFNIFFAARMDYHVPFLRIIFCSVPLDFSGPRECVPKNAFPLKRNAYFFSVLLTFPLRSLCVP